MSPHPVIFFSLGLTPSLRFPSMSRFVRFFLPPFLSLVVSSPFSSVASPTASSRPAVLTPEDKDSEEEGWGIFAEFVGSELEVQDSTIWGT